MPTWANVYLQVSKESGNGSVEWSSSMPLRKGEELGHFLRENWKLRLWSTFSAVQIQKCRKICGLGCVNRARIRARVTQPSPCISLHICRRDVIKDCVHCDFCTATFDNVYLDHRVEAGGHGHGRRPILCESIPRGGSIAKSHSILLCCSCFPMQFRCCCPQEILGGLQK